MSTNDLMILILAFTCVGLFIATAIATALDLFNLLKLAPDIRKKLHAVLLVEIAVIAVAAFKGFLNPNPIAQTVERVEKVERDKIQLEKQISDSTAVVVDFPWVDTASAPGYAVAAAPYLHGVGISIAAKMPQTSEIVLINNRALYQGAAVHPTTSQNLLTQITTNNLPASFTLAFSRPLDSLSFIRPALYAATKSGITHPAWSAHAFNAAGHELSSQGEDLIRSFDDVSARRYELRAPGFDGIVAVRFNSDPQLNGKPFAAFGAILIERLIPILKTQ